jgi:uncharacterized protein
MNAQRSATKVLDSPSRLEGDEQGAARGRRAMSIRTLAPFLAITFGLTWGLGALLIPFGEQVEAVFGELGPTNPVYLILVYSPAIAAFFLVWRHYGTHGVGSFLRRLTLWQMPRAWWVFLLIGIPAMVYASAAFAGTVTDFPFSPWHGVFAALGLALVFGPIEEFGWRGLGLPLLQQRFAPLWAGLILGFVWAIWHLPAFLFSGTVQSSWSLVPFIVGVIALSVILTAVFNASRGSILLAALFHFQMMNPVFPDADPWDKLVFVAAAVVVVLINRRAMLSRAGAVTEVLAPAPAVGDTEAGQSRAAVRA